MKITNYYVVWVILVNSLSKKIDIDTWKRIADCVQRLNFYYFSQEEFDNNLILLRKLLLDLEIDIDFLSRYPTSVNDVGLASLLEEIYISDVLSDYKKANFYEKIFQLDMIGVRYIQFLPVEFIDNVKDIYLIKDDMTKENVWIKKCFTDGSFDIGYFPSKYDVINICDANYVINVISKMDNAGKVVLDDECYAILKNFNGKFPDKESMFEIRYPGLCTYFKQIDDDRRQLILKQIFYTVDMMDVRYDKKLVRRSNEFYYE